ncbi:MAG: isoprenylcysteine carboxylmethyltransferase family protein [Lautropia sp.]
MKSLELKVPPPVVMLLAVAAMWGLARAMPALVVPIPDGLRQVIGVALIVLGVAMDLACAFRFWRAGTTINPLRPDASAALVTTGLFRFSRNPMYLGMLVALIGWAVLLASPPALLGTGAFVWYLSRFQILPEERALAARFPQQFADYAGRVRRWL